MTSAAMTDDSAFKWKNSYEQLMYDYSIAAQSQVDKWVPMWPLIFAFLSFVLQNFMLQLQRIEEH